MVKINIQGVERYYDGYIVDNLEHLRKAVELNWDGIIYVGGYEGDAKSTFTMQCAMYLDQTFNIDRCVFTPEQLITEINKASKGQAIVYDEAQDVFDSGASRDKTARIIKSKLTRIRSKGLYIFIVAPDFWRINKYLFIHRSRAFIRVYADGLERGYFAFYNRERKHMLYIKGKKEENIHIIDPNFRGRFTNWLPIDEQAYLTKKEQSTKDIVINDESQPSKQTRQVILKEQVRLLNFLRRNQWVKPGVVGAAASFLGISERTYQNYATKQLFSDKNLADNEDVPVFQAESAPEINHDNLTSSLVSDLRGLRGEEDEDY